MGRRIKRPDPKVLVVVTNWKRPGNLARVAAAFRAQTRRVFLALYDNHPAPEFAPAARDLALFDDVFSSRVNLGPPCRWLPALAHPGLPWAYLSDDDLVPGPRAVEHFLRRAYKLKGEFAVLGHAGVRFGVKREGTGFWKVFRSQEVGRPTKVDATGRVHFFRAADLHHVLRLRAAMAGRRGGNHPLFGEDDMLLNVGIQWGTGRPSYVLPAGPEERAIAERLPAPHPRRRVPWVRFWRFAWPQQAWRQGWRPLWKPGD